MIAINVKVDTAGLAALHRAMEHELPETFQHEAEFFIRDVVSRQMSGRAGNIYVNRVSGTLARGWWSEVVQGGGRLVARVWTDVKYAGVHEFGGKHHRQRLFVRKQFEDQMAMKFRDAVLTIFRRRG